MLMLRTRISVRRSMLVVAVIALGLGVFEAVLGPFQDHRRWYDRVQADLESLKQKRPRDIERAQWAYVIGWTLNAHGNCGGHPNFVDSDMAELFADELENKLRGEVGMDTIDWIWDEYMRFSKVKSYDQFRPTSPERLKESRFVTWSGIVVD